MRLARPSRLGQAKGLVQHLAGGLAQVRSAIDTDATAATLERWIESSNVVI